MSPIMNTTIGISRVTRVIAYESYVEGEIASWSHPIVVHTLIAITVLVMMGAIMVFLGLIEEVLNGWMGVNV
jgi:spore maturation protein SpmB